MTATATASAPETRAPSQSVILHNVSWRTYECLLKDFENSSAPRFAYDRGTLEIMSPLPEHEERNRNIAMIVEIVAEERGLSIRNFGSTTFRQRAALRGFEPDSCFYIQSAGRLPPRVTRIDLTKDPPPDLVIEIDVTSPSLPKFPLYAQMSVPEVWRDTDEEVTIFALQDGEFVERRDSVALPGLTAATLTHFVQATATLARLEWLRTVREWARSHPQGPNQA